jgi:hypothetical protein
MTCLLISWCLSGFFQQTDYLRPVANLFEIHADASKPKLNILAADNSMAVVANVWVLDTGCTMYRYTRYIK